MFCRLELDQAITTFQLDGPTLQKVQLLGANNQSKPDWKGAGVIAYALYMVGLTSIFRCWWWDSKWHMTLLRLLMSGPWLLLRLPKRLWASDATPTSADIVDKRARLVYCDFFKQCNIYKVELFMPWKAAWLAPQQLPVITKQCLGP